MSEFVASVIESGNTRIASVKKFLAKPPRKPRRKSRSASGRTAR